MRVAIRFPLLVGVLTGLTFSTQLQDSVQLFGIMAGSRWGLKGQEDIESLVYAGVPS
jgi:predicted porin